ncbi:hypothetical protein V3C99_006232 [Haemonchus contortus]
MEDTDSTFVDDFRFPWEHLADFYAVFQRTNSADGTTLDYDCCLSRVHLNDKDLVKLSERKRIVESPDTDALADSVVAMGLSDNDDNDNALTLQTCETSEGQVTGVKAKLPELKADAWAELPKRFGSAKKQDHSKYYRKRKRTIDDAQRWLKDASFDEYWEDTASYLVYRTWYEDYGSIMNEDDRNSLAKQVEECKPVALITAHTEEHIAKYFGLTKDVKFSSYEELFALHSEAVMKLAEKDFELFRISLTSQRCKTFLKKIEKMGFVPGYSKSDIISPGDEARKPDEEAPEEKKVKREHKRRFSVIYGDDEIFSDIYYDVYDPYAASMGVVLNRKEKTAEDETSGAVGATVDEDQSDELEKKDALPEKDGKPETNVSFAFDPIKDAHLVAKNAYEAYRDDEEIIKYWYQRYRLFSKLDKGILMDREGWFSVTPERIAEHIADRMVRQPNVLIVDAFAGVGGNSIQLALKGAQVIAIDLDPVRLKCARENAKVYGVDDRIEFVCGDFFHFAAKWTNDVGRSTEVDAVFLSPPWGGPSYLKSKDFDLDDLTPNGFDIYTAARKMSPNIAYFLPRNTKVKQLISLSGPGGRCEIEQSCLNKKIKTLTAYFGNLAVQRDE